MTWDTASPVDEAMSTAHTWDADGGVPEFQRPDVIRFVVPLRR